MFPMLLPPAIFGQGIHSTFFSLSPSWYTYKVIVTLNDFQEESGSVLHGLGEDLEKVALVVEVH